MKKIIGMTILIVFIFFGCKKDKKETDTFYKAKIDGLSQKGPFVNGSSLTLFELNESFLQTGKSFNTQILDNLGSFEINNIEIQTSFAKLKADGFYFNEITNSNSNAAISLYAMSDITNKNTVNVNLLSTLEVSRIEYLLNQGLTFNAAKQQAQSEILNIFSIQKSGIPESELLDISKEGDNNAILLAVSLILQGYRTEAELTQLLGDISTDIRTDGILNSPTLGSSLINDTKLLSLTNIRSNIENKYISLGITTTIPDFEKYINLYKDSCNYTVTNNIVFPDTGIYGINILNADTIYSPGSNYSICANLPNGTHLKIINNSWAIAYETGTLNGWFQPVPGTYESNQCGLIDGHINLGTGNATLMFYENYSLVPTRIKNIYIQ
ncbi:MAG: hypothetical protein HY951_19260 [Bacteroidia bacterium]|nr:hypothetical protein [Bacteroidia bacterium]